MSGLRVLLADDEQDILETIGTRIESWGYDLLTALDGDRALEIVNSGKPDIVVLDYLMPKKNGLVTLKALRKINRDIPVIMFTAYSDEKSIKGAENLGVIAFVPKISAYSDSQQALRAALGMAEKTIVREDI
ncbi:MAG: response regulator [Candidatus Omnitrophica bacterium]|nr:response regulator [Candidatus Omnitrophota bacterium]MBU2473948.1 response regulator [Candidatus Omnitrophota bacterium]